MDPVRFAGRLGSAGERDRGHSQTTMRCAAIAAFGELANLTAPDKHPLVMTYRNLAPRTKDYQHPALGLFSGATVISLCWVGTWRPPLPLECRLLFRGCDLIFLACFRGQHPCAGWGRGDRLHPTGIGPPHGKEAERDLRPAPAGADRQRQPLRWLYSTTDS